MGEPIEYNVGKGISYQFRAGVLFIVATTCSQLFFNFEEIYFTARMTSIILIQRKSINAELSNLQATKQSEVI